MMTPEEYLAFRIKLLKGLELAYARLIEYKKQKKSKLVVMREGKIVWLDPEDA